MTFLKHSVVLSLVLNSTFFILHFFLPLTVFALSSTNYGVNQYSLTNGNETLSSTNYRLQTTLGPILGVASSTNYGLDIGFPSITGGTISLALDSSTVSLGQLTPGTPVTNTTTATVTTDAINGYSLAIQKNQLLTHTTDGSTTISDVSGSIDSPSAWSGTGFGFTVSSGTSLEAKWGSGSNFAAIPTQLSTSAHTVASATNAANQSVIGYKLDTASSQKAGSYNTIVAFIASARP